MSTEKPLVNATDALSRAKTPRQGDQLKRNGMTLTVTAVNDTFVFIDVKRDGDVEHETYPLESWPRAIENTMRIPGTNFFPAEGGLNAQ